MAEDRVGQTGAAGSDACDRRPPCWKNAMQMSSFTAGPLESPEIGPVTVCPSRWAGGVNTHVQLAGLFDGARDGLLTFGPHFPTLTFRVPNERGLWAHRALLDGSGWMDRLRS